MRELPVFVAAYLLSATVAATIAVLSWRRRAVTSAAAGLALSLAGAAWWSLGDAVLALLRLWEAPPAATSFTFAWVIPGVAATVLGFFWLCRGVADPGWWPRSHTSRLLLVEPLLVVAAAVLQPRVDVMTGVAGPRSSLWFEWTPGWGFWAQAAYNYVLLAWAFGLLLRAARHGGRLQRQQVACLLAGSLVPLVANSLTLYGPARNALPDLTAVSFVATGVIDGFALFRLGLLRLVPVARGLVLDRLADALYVLDHQGRILDANRAGQTLARRMAPELPAQIVGMPARAFVERHHLPVPLVAGEYPVSLDGEDLVFDVRIEHVRDRRERSLARVVVVRDVTPVHRHRRELADVNDRLRQQIATIDVLRAELAELAVRDELTGLHNRRYLVTALERELEIARVRGTELCVVILDLDRFKSVNDRFGHAVGDTLLAETARMLAAALRDTDSVARYGGEEFVVLLPGASLDQAYVRAQQWRLRCMQVSVETPAGPVTTTVSAGVAAASMTDGTAQSVLKAADEALYRAKAEGRNRVVPAEPVPR